jgi:hypothetical protein
MGTVECLSAAPILRARSVPSAYFISMIRDYETKYQMDWITFYTEHRNSVEELDEDFSSWLFLCKAYFADLVAATGPPLEKECKQKPERDSGFCYLRGNMSALARQSTPLRSSHRPSTQLL